MPSEEIEKPYYATMTLQWDSQLVFNEAGYIYIQDAVKTYKTYNLTREDPGSREIFYHMARIDHDGVFRLYKHLRDNTSDRSCPSSWTIMQVIPDDICGALASDHVNAGDHDGFCRPNCICSTLYNSSGRAFCSCPDEFSPLIQLDNWAGCKPNFPLPSCHKGWEKK